jgi:hypothetical protein
LNAGKNASEAAAAILSRIAELKNQYTDIATAAEKPVTVAGTTRGTGIQTTDIKAEKFYAKTIRIKH